MTNRQMLLVVERGLLAVSLGLALWCGVRIVEGRYFHDMPVSSIPHIYVDTLPREPKTLPGDEGSNGSVGTTGRTRTRVEIGEVLAKLEAPSVKMTATILEGTDDRTLSRGAGHIEETAFPGETGNFAIAGHRDTTFRAVRNIKIGDPLIVTTADGVFQYRITKTFIVEPTDVYVLDPTEQPTLTLVTCYPFDYIGHAPHRFIVRAELEKEGR
jgi:LPXTG-site transpeptidase (sortase) family protein